MESSSESPLPQTVAAIDIGSNALRCSITRIVSPILTEVVDSARLPLRLGHDVFQSGRLGVAAMERALKGLAHFRDMMDGLSVARYRAVATSAVRESKNGRELVARARRESGLRVDVINGAEEARLVFLAVRDRVPLGDGRWIIVDLGGGSVEISFASKEGILWTESRPIGSVRLIEELSGSGEQPESFGRLLADYVSAIRLPRSARPGKISGLVATGGNIESLARIGAQADSEERTVRLPVARLRSLARELSRMSYSERIQAYRLKEDRADVILPAAHVYLRLAELMGSDEIVVPFVGLKEGIIMEMVEDLTGRAPSAEDRSRQTWDTALNLGRKFGFDEAHAVRVATLASSLFEQLQDLHGLEASDGRLLAASALLHDVGTFVAYSRHHKHSFYLIAQSQLTGFSSHEMHLVALVARYHRKSAPSLRHPDFFRLAEADRLRVRKLAGILRIADALDCEHAQKVSGVRAGIDPQAVTLRLEGSGDLLLETWEARKKARLFVSLFRRGFEIQDGGTR